MPLEDTIAANLAANPQYLRTRLTPEDSALVSARETLLTENENAVIRGTLRTLLIDANHFEVPTDKGDECAKLEAALIRYVIASRR